MQGIPIGSLWSGLFLAADRLRFAGRVGCWPAIDAFPEKGMQPTEPDAFPTFRFFPDSGGVQIRTRQGLSVAGPGSE